MEESTMFFGGMPTGPDVKLLNEKWPEPKAGDEFPYSEIGETTKLQYGTSRFKSVCEAWKADLQKRGIILGFVRGVSLKVLTDDQVIDGSADDFSSVKRKLRKRRAMLLSINTYDSITAAKRDNAARLCQEMERRIGETKRRLTAPNVVSLPTVAPPDDKEACGS